MGNEQHGKGNFDSRKPTLAFASICDDLGIKSDGVEETFKTVSSTLWTYQKYLKNYIGLLKGKSMEYSLESTNHVVISLRPSDSKAWYVIPKNVIAIESEEPGWFVCKEKIDARTGDFVNVSPGREGQRILDDTNYRIKGGRSQFKFPELEKTLKIVIFGETYAVRPVTVDISESSRLAIDNHDVQYRILDDGNIEVCSAVDARLTVDGIDMKYQIIEDNRPSKCYLYDAGYLVVSKGMPSGNYSSVRDVTKDIIKNSEPSDLLFEGKDLSEYGFSRDYDKLISSVEFTGFNRISHKQYKDLIFNSDARLVSSKNRYKIMMPDGHESESGADPRMGIFEDNAILKYENRRLEIVWKDLDAMEVKFKAKDEKPLDLKSNFTLEVSFDTRDMESQNRVLDSLLKNPPSHAAPLINMFRLQKGKGGWPDFKIGDPEHGWRVLTDPSFSGCEEQRDFVRKALSTPDFAILDGPPGTGKTTAIRELIIQLILSGKRVLVASSTNAAIDNVLERIITEDCRKEENRDFKDALIPVRLGLEEKTSDEIKEYSTERIVKSLSGINVGGFSIEDILIQSSNLVCGTIAKVYSEFRPVHDEERLWLRNISQQPLFDYLIMDESSKTTFQEFVVPAIMARHWILAGDIRQLSPFTDENVVESTLDMFTGMESEFKVTEEEKEAAVLVNEAHHIVHNRNNERRYSIIVRDEVAMEIQREYAIRKEDKNGDSRMDGQCVILFKNQSYSKLYSSKVVFISSSMYEEMPDILPLDSYVADLSGKCYNLAPDQYRYRWLCRFEGWDKLCKGIEKDLENFDKTWAETIAWRLNRDFWLRNSGVNKGKYIGQIYPRIPGRISRNEEQKKKFMNESVYKVQNVLFHSILELLTATPRDDKDRQNMVQSFDPEEMNYRKESLRFQHRMHPDISQTPSKRFYDGGLLDGPKVKSRKFGYDPTSFGGKRSVWIDCRGDDWIYKNGKKVNNVNENEMDIIEKHLVQFTEWAREQKNQDYSVIILTFYLAQCNEMKERFRTLKQRAGNVRVKIATVDYIQGQEADVVFMSMVRQKKIGFMDTPNRLNVAITRAKHLMVFVGNKDLFAGSNSTKDLQAIVEGCYCMQS